MSTDVACVDMQEAPAAPVRRARRIRPNLPTTLPPHHALGTWTQYTVHNAAGDAVGIAIVCGEGHVFVEPPNMHGLPVETPLAVASQPNVKRLVTDMAWPVAASLNA